MSKLTLKRIREDCGMTRKEVAEKVGVSVFTYRKWEYGTRSPSIDNVLRLSFIFEESAEDIIVSIINSRPCAQEDSQR